MYDLNVTVSKCTKSHQNLTDSGNGYIPLDEHITNLSQTCGEPDEMNLIFL